MRVHNNLIALMKNRGVKGKDLAVATGIPISSISEGVNGKRVFTDAQLEAICESLGVTVDQIYPDNQLREALAE